MPFSLPAEAQSTAQLVEYLADPHRYVLACQQLIGLGAEASDAARDGLRQGRLVRARWRHLPPDGTESAGGAVPGDATMTYGA